MKRINSHPANDLLMDYHKGNLSPNHSLVIAAHLEICSECRSELRFLDSLGGELIEDIEEVHMSDHSLERALARIEVPYEEPVKPKRHALIEKQNLPKCLDYIKFDKPYFAAPGVWIAKVSNHNKETNSSYLMNVKAGMQMPPHTHNGIELTLILKGSYTDNDMVYAKGDIAITDGNDIHSPQINSDEDCLCFVSCDNKIIPKTLLGSIVQNFARI